MIQICFIFLFVYYYILIRTNKTELIQKHDFVENAKINI